MNPDLLQIRTPGLGVAATRPLFRHTFVYFRPQGSPGGDSIVDPGRSYEVVFGGNGLQGRSSHRAAGKTSLVRRFTVIRKRRGLESTAPFQVPARSLVRLPASTGFASRF